jgi:hypothetical protein
VDSPPPLLRHVHFQDGVWWSSETATTDTDALATLVQHQKKRSRAQSERVAQSNSERGGGAVRCQEVGCTASVGTAEMAPSRLLTSICQHLQKVHGKQGVRLSVHDQYGLPALRACKRAKGAAKAASTEDEPAARTSFGD